MFQIEAISAYDGEVEKLGNAEKFFHALIHVDGFKMRIETMILKGDFNSQLVAIRPNIKMLNTICRKLIDNESLMSFLRFLLHTGNFINKVHVHRHFIYTPVKHVSSDLCIHS